ncbi:unnamed protein product [Paramecium primaurelia]|uniref:Uncharacterized protein n=1 Tax=Paramecium primaurelia TaxID=5886 RepID=A0A8S1M4V0_PARPR|nr:unnamed protein product [Paramecium primaurelia]
MLKDYQDYYSHFSDKRVKERSVDEALYRVREWRRIYEQGISQECNKKSRITLQEAANIVKIPKKTLEDYIQIFNKVSLMGQKIEDFSNKKMGFLRAFIRKNKGKIRKAALIKKQNKKDSIDVKSEDSFSQKIKIECQYSRTYSIKEEYEPSHLNQNVKEEIKEEQSESYSQNIFSTNMKF